VIQENEIIMLTLGIGLYFFIVAYKPYFQRIPEWKILLYSFRIILAAWFLTVIEGFFLSKVFNILEHFCYAASAFTMAIWCFKITRKKIKDT